MTDEWADLRAKAEAANVTVLFIEKDKLLRLLDERDRLREAVEGMAYQFGYWSSSVGGISTGGLSALEDAWIALGWDDDPRPVPEMRCDEPGCMEQISSGWPTRPGGTGTNGGYRRTCHTHWCAAHPGECKSHPVSEALR